MLRDQVSPIGESPAFLELQERTSRIAAIDRPVLVVGERGTGKELIAARLHFLSPRWEGPFVKLNCAAIAENLIESELFGHASGIVAAQRFRWNVFRHQELQPVQQLRGRGLLLQARHLADFVEGGERRTHKVALDVGEVDLNDPLHRLAVGKADVVEETAAQEGVRQFLLVVRGDHGGIEVAAVVDLRTEVAPSCREALDAAGIELLTGHAVAATHGSNTVWGAEVMRTFTDTGDNDVTAFLRQRSSIALGVLDGHLADRSFVVAERPTIADFSLCGYLYWPEEIGVSWADYPGISAWLDRIAALPGWVHPYELMPGHPLPGKS